MPLHKLDNSKNILFIFYDFFGTIVFFAVFILLEEINDYLKKTVSFVDKVVYLFKYIPDQQLNIVK